MKTSLTFADKVFTGLILWFFLGIVVMVIQDYFEYFKKKGEQDEK